MKKMFLLIVPALLLSSCTSISKLTNLAIYHAIVGQNEKIINSRLGIPASISPSSDGGRIMIYESYTKGIFQTPYKSRVTYSPKMNLNGNREGFVFHSGVYTKTNDPKYTIYQKDVSYIKVYLDKQGTCVRFEQNLPRKQMERYYEQFKHYIPKD